MEGHGTQDPPNPGLNLDPAGLGALADALQKSISNPPSSTPKEHSPVQSSSTGGSTNTNSTGDENNNVAEGGDGDDEVFIRGEETGAAHPTYKPRSRGGNKHKKNLSTPVTAEEVNAEEIRTAENPDRPDPTDPLLARTRKAGRPPGSANRRFKKERSSSRRRTAPSTYDQKNERSRSRDERRKSREEPPTRTTRHRAPEKPSSEHHPDHHPSHSDAAGPSHSMLPPQQHPTPGPSNQPTTLVRATPSGDVPHDAQPWANGEIDAISELISSRCAGGATEHFTNEEPGLQTVRMDFLPAPTFDPNLSVDLDESRVFDVRDLVTSTIEVRSSAQLRSRDVLQFVLLARPKTNPSNDIPGPVPIVPDDSTGDPAMDTAITTPASVPRTSWTIPDIMTFNDVINRAECRMVSERMPCLRAQKWINTWGRVGLVGLSARDPDLIRQYRNVVEQIHDPHQTYTIFPRDAADKRGSISVLLQDSFRAFDPMCLPGSLFTRNRGLKGALKVTHIKSYREDEKSRSGQSKRDWRLIVLQGCAVFMDSLEAYDEDHKFSIGSGHVFIKGGMRRSKSNRGGPSGGPNNNNNTNSNRVPLGRGSTRNRNNPRHEGHHPGQLNRSHNKSVEYTGQGNFADGRGRGRGGPSAPDRSAPAGPGRRASSGSRRNK